MKSQSVQSYCVISGSVPVVALTSDCTPLSPMIFVITSLSELSVKDTLLRVAVILIA